MNINIFIAKNKILFNKIDPKADRRYLKEIKMNPSEVILCYKHTEAVQTAS